MLGKKLVPENESYCPPHSPASDVASTPHFDPSYTSVKIPEAEGTVKIPKSF